MPNYFISQAKLVEGETLTWGREFVMPNCFISHINHINRCQRTSSVNFCNSFVTRLTTTVSCECPSCPVSHNSGDDYGVCAAAYATEH